MRYMSCLGKARGRDDEIRAWRTPGGACGETDPIVPICPSEVTF